MKVEAAVTRIINERGNQVLIVTGSVLSENAQGVLPEGKELAGEFLELSVKGGTCNFSFQVEAAEPAEKVEVPKLLTELTRQEQEDVFLKSQLADPNLDAVSRTTIEQKLGSTPAVVADKVENPDETVHS